MAESFGKDSRLEQTGTGELWCVECGKKIEGEPYTSSFHGWDDNFDNVYFCSRECWEGSELFNTDKWGK